jgi:hypothetical protein
MAPVFRFLAILAVTALSAGCKVAPCDEFAPAFDRRPEACPPKVNQSQLVPPPADQPNPSAPRYCYTTLAQVECYTQPQPGRTGYMGAYAPNAIPTAQTAVSPAVP